jgi:uncharacterized protein YlxP (DUF503 family)
MFAVALRVDIRIPMVTSLKEKRRVVQRLQAGVRHFDVAVAEVDFQDQHRRTTLGVAAVSSSTHQLNRVLHNVERWLRAQPEIEVLGVETGWLVPE